MNYRKNFIVKPGAEVKLADHDPDMTDDKFDKHAAKAQLEHNRKRLCELQGRLYAEHRQSVLVGLQGLDAAGKDGTITHVFGALNPMGCDVTAFKVPTPDELAHDFVWRYHKRTPARGHITVFNRTIYESVLVERVHKLVKKSVWSTRYDRINDFESMLAEDGTTILKFFLNISKDEQLKRFRDRLDNPEKRWKISEADYEERELWSDYIDAYEDALERCSTAKAPWFVIPSNHKWFRDLAISQIVADALDDLKIEEPKPSVDLAEIRAKYHAAVVSE